MTRSHTLPAWAKTILLTFGAIGVIAAAIRFGPLAISYAFIPPERGYFRYYQDFDMEKRETYWNYWNGDGTMISSADLRRRYYVEKWELVPDQGNRHFLYDAWNEFDGRVTFTRTEMVVYRLDGEEAHYPRELDLWKIRAEREKANTNEDHYRRLAPDRGGHQKRVATRMKERGIAVAPDMDAQRRPPAPRPAVTDSGPAQPVPLLAITEFGFGDDTGTVFAVYADGLVLCRSLPENPAAPFHQLRIPDAARFVRELLGPDAGCPGERITLSDATDQVVTMVWTPEKAFSIYGNWRKPDAVDWKPPEELTEDDRQLNERMKQRWDSLPAGIRPALQKIDELRSAPGPAWLPPRIEVRFGEYEHAADPPTEWPAEWPGLYASTSIKHGAGEYSVYVPAAEFVKLRAFLRTESPRGAVMIDLNQMGPSMRLPLPAEDRWLKHLPAW